MSAVSSIRAVSWPSSSSPSSCYHWSTLISSSWAAGLPHDEGKLVPESALFAKGSLHLRVTCTDVLFGLQSFFMQMWVTRRGFLSHTDVPFLFKMMVVAACCTAIKPLSSSSRLKEACSYLTLTLSWGAFPSQVVDVSLHKDTTGAQSKENCFYVDFSEWLLQTHYCSVFKMHLCKYLF